MPAPDLSRVDPHGLFAQLEEESDRAAAILGVAFLDYLLGQVFRTHLDPASNPEIFEFRGALGDLSSKIDMAHALGWIDTATRSDFHILRRIRNDFAHDIDHTLALTDGPRRDRLNGLALSRYVRERLQVDLTARGYPELAAEEAARRFSNPHTLFRLAISVSSGLMAQLIRSERGQAPAPLSIVAFVAPILSNAITDFTSQVS